MRTLELETNDTRERRLGAARDVQRVISINRDSIEDRRLNKWKRNSSGIEWYNAAFNYSNTIEYHSDARLSIGTMSNVCRFCKANRFKNEANGICCNNGKVIIELLKEPPYPLYDLLLGRSEDSMLFYNNIRNYNSAFQMTSFGASKIIRENFMPTFKIQGQVYHNIGSIYPVQNDDEKYLQIYFMGNNEDELNKRNEYFPCLRRSLLTDIQELLHANHVKISEMKYALENTTEHNFKLVIREDLRPVDEHARRFNRPTSNEVAILMVGESTNKRDIIIHKRDSTVQRINETHPAYDCLQYPLIFWKGQDGYGINLMQSNFKKLSCMNYYAYLIMVRDNDINLLLHYRELFHQFATDMYAEIEGERLSYIRFNQSKLRADSYDNLKDAMQNDGDIDNLGQMIILPSTFTGSPRYMQERQQDAMTYVRKFGKPDLFITTTCNPQCKEILENLFTNQKCIHRHDITARVFRQNIIKLIDLIKNAKIYGKVKCHMYTIEWQKRGLPHAHILVWLVNRIKPEDVDKIISSEIPNIDEYEELFNIVVKNMIHGPCGLMNSNLVCMCNNKCSKEFPKKYRNDTKTDRDGYPLYRRRSPENGGNIVNKILKGKEVVIDNRWVVPYSPLLCKIFNAHINVELCNSVKSIKYICKYINKGSDMAMIGIDSSDKYDEIKRFQMARYISSNEAIWRILDFPIHQRYPAITQLSVHLENGQKVYFNDHNITERMRLAPTTTLVAYFEICKTDIFAKTLLYQDIPQYYTWQQASKIWKRRVEGDRISEGIFKSDTIGRMYTVHPKNTECFHLRLLLSTVKGPTSFKDLKTVQGEECITYKKACQLLNLLEDDNHWELTLNEAALIKSPYKLRTLFAMMICYCEISDIPRLWINNRESMAEDIAFRLNNNSEGEQTDREYIYNKALMLIQNIVLNMGGNKLVQYGFSEIYLMEDDIHNQDEYTECEVMILENEPKLNQEQRLVYNTILASVNNEDGKLFFLDAPAGTGKTFIINLLLATIKLSGKYILAVASSGIASTLLLCGRTAHSVFKIPIKLTEDSICNVLKNSKIADGFRNCKFIVWDECTMIHKHALHAVDRMLRDITNNDVPMGGITLQLSGDFRQILPVVIRGSKADHINACIKSSALWRHIISLNLKTNMRVYTANDDNAHIFADNLLLIGDGKMEKISELDVIPCGNMVDNIKDLIERIYPDLHINYIINDWLCERSILAQTNDNVRKINNYLLNILPGDSISYKSIDRVLKDEEAVDYPIEFLNSIKLSGLPDHLLTLKIGVPIMLLRNLNPPKLCNGSRLVITNLNKHILEARILTGAYKGTKVIIPNLPIIPTEYPFNFRRLQFPVKVCFSMTINKAQGQSFKVIGLDLDTECFSHGQLYVGCSRASTEKELYILAKNGKTKNIVYKEIL